MIKIESVEGICTITREGEECVLFVGMQITPEEVGTIVAGGDLVYSIDESQVVVVAKGTKATVSAVMASVPAEEVATEVVAKTEAASAAVVPSTVETIAEIAKKK
jgi:hypothetical protein